MTGLFSALLRLSGGEMCRFGEVQLAKNIRPTSKGQQWGTPLHIWWEGRVVEPRLPHDRIQVERSQKNAIEVTKPRMNGGVPHADGRVQWHGKEDLLINQVPCSPENARRNACVFGSTRRSLLPRWEKILTSMCRSCWEEGLRVAHSAIE